MNGNLSIGHIKALLLGYDAKVIALKQRNSTQINKRRLYASITYDVEGG